MTRDAPSKMEQEHLFWAWWHLEPDIETLWLEPRYCCKFDEGVADPVIVQYQASRQLRF